MDTHTDQLPLFRAALEAEDTLFAHTAHCEQCTDLVVCAEAKRLLQHAETLRRRALDQDGGQFDLDTVMTTAESIVRDILLIVTAGRIDDDARAAFRDWIVDALLTQPTAHYVDQLCRAAGFAGPVEPDVMQARVAEFRATLGAQLHKLAECHEFIATLRAAGQTVLTTWERGDLANAVRQLAALLPE